MYNRGLCSLWTNSFIIMILLLSACTLNEDDDIEKIPHKYSFFVAGHTYGKPGVDNVGLHPPFKAKFDFIKNDELMKFGVLTGDVVLNGSETNWDEVDSDIVELGIPVYIAVGNHDMGDRNLYESRYGITYFKFSFDRDLFIILDPNIDKWNISDDQLVFLLNAVNALQDSTCNIFVFFHQVLWWASDNIFRNIAVNSYAGRDSVINFWDDVEPIFHNRKNPVFMFAGDVGAFNTGDEYVYYSYDNITLIASGMGSEVRDNFVIVDVDVNNKVSFRLIALNGNDINALGRLENYSLDTISKYAHIFNNLETD